MGGLGRRAGSAALAALAKLYTVLADGDEFTIAPNGQRVAFTHGGGTLAAILPRLNHGWTLNPFKGQALSPLEVAKKLRKAVERSVRMVGRGHRILRD